MHDSVNKKVTSNLMWRLLERFGAQGVTFIVSILLARLLDPSVYGTVALITVFTTILQVFVDSGLGNALIQKKDADNTDFSTVFYFNVIACLFMYSLMFFFSPLIAKFYGMPELTPMIRVLSLTIVISGVKNVQQAYVSKHLLFKKFFFATLGGTIGAAIIGIILAYMGFGAWALIAQNLFNLTVDTIILWITVKWRPKKAFSFERLKGLFSYGWKLLASSVLTTFYNELRQLLIGKLYSTSDLGYYNRGKQVPNLVASNINNSIDSVLFPVMSSEQDDQKRLRAMTRRSIKTSSYLMMPIMVGLAACADSLVLIVLTEKWLPAVFFLRCCCFTFAFYPIHTANRNAIKAMGKSNYILIMGIIEKVIGLGVLFGTMFISVKAIALGHILVSVLCQIINAWPNKKLLNYSYGNQIIDIIPNICISLLMGIIVYSVEFLRLNNYLTLLIQIPLGAFVYILMSKLFKNDSFDYIRGIVKNNRKRPAEK